MWVALDMGVRKQLLDDYKISFFRNDSGESYWIDDTTCSGIQLAPKGKAYVILSGVDYVQYFQDNELNLTLDSDLEGVFEFLKRKDATNKERMSSVVLFINDVATRDRLGVV